MTGKITFVLSCGLAGLCKFEVHLHSKSHSSSNYLIMNCLKQYLFPSVRDSLFYFIGV